MESSTKSQMITATVMLRMRTQIAKEVRVAIANGITSEQLNDRIAIENCFWKGVSVTKEQLVAIMKAEGYDEYMIQQEMKEHYKCSF